MRVADFAIAIRGPAAFCPPSPGWPGVPGLPGWPGWPGWAGASTVSHAVVVSSASIWAESVPSPQSSLSAVPSRERSVSLPFSPISVSAPAPPSSVSSPLL